MKNTPKKIYLQVDADGERPEDFDGLVGVSWCADKINDSDIEKDNDIRALYLIREAMKISTPRMRKANLTFAVDRPEFDNIKIS